MLRKRKVGLLWKTKVTFVLLCAFVLLIIAVVMKIADNDITITYKESIISNGETLLQRPKKVPIFFLETSVDSELTFREACSVESAIFHNPNQTVTLYSLGRLSRSNALYQTLVAFPNFRHRILDLAKIFKETPMEGMDRLQKFTKSEFPIVHLSEGVRLALLWKNGGIYLDTDIITLRLLDNLQNTLGMESLGHANNAVLAFDQWNTFIYQCMEDFVDNFYNDSQGQQSSLLMTRMLKTVCSTKDINGAIGKSQLCQGVTIRPQSSFNPINYNQLDTLFTYRRRPDLHGAYTVHLWNSLTMYTQPKPGTGTFLETLAMENCPSIYNLMLINKSI